MSALDVVVMVSTIAAIVAYGTWKSRGVQSMQHYFRGDDNLKWATIGLSVMATQASAITFISMPGQGYEDGLRFVQFYFGLPLAMIVISAVFVPIYYRLKIYTAYEYLEHRFDVRVRTLGALLFLVQRGLSAGITIYAPSIILSTLLGWPLHTTNLAIGLVVIIYTVAGGTQAVSQTQKPQMVLMLAGICLAAVLVVLRLPPRVGLGDAVRLAGALGRVNAVSFEFDWHSRYNFWSGITGGFFLAMSYFGTDQSQVQRYLSGRSVTESRLGLLFNGALKIPMQFLILFIGVLVFVFYIFVAPPMFFNQPALARLARNHSQQVQALQTRYDAALVAQRDAAYHFVSTTGHNDGARQAARDSLRAAAATVNAVRQDVKTLFKQVAPETETTDTDYVFLTFIMEHVPHGLVGLLLAVILCAAMASTASELTALGSTTMVDLFQRMRQTPLTRDSELRWSKVLTAAWGLFAVAFASFAALLDNLIEAVNILGSVFYGTVLGLFMVAFFFKKVTATPVFVAALVAQAVVLILFFASSVGFLWYNVIGCVIVMTMAPVLQTLQLRAHSS